MRKHLGKCSPEQLHTLQKILDLIWMELRASSTGKYSGPSDPDTLRDEIARRVAKDGGNRATDLTGIIQSVLRSFGIDPSNSITLNGPHWSLSARLQWPE